MIMKKIISIILSIFVCISLVACGKNTSDAVDNNVEIGGAYAVMEENISSLAANVIDDKYRNYYEVFVYSFCDSDGDGIGDFKGLTSKLSYISDLGFNGIWLMPIMPSPTYHKYDVTNYCDIDPEYGTMADFEELISACHEMGINVIIDMVINHTSSQHPWFVAAKEAYKNGDSNNQYLSYYNFSNEPQDGYAKLNGFDGYYEARFWSEMPDLNLGNENVRKEIESIVDFWIDKGVDGFRLDAVTSYYTEDINASTDALKWFCDYVYSKDENQYIVAEAWSASDSIAKYYESGIDSCFNFPFAGAEGIIAKTVNGTLPGGAAGFGKAVAEVNSLYSGANSEFIDAPFYTNHDMARGAGYYTGEWGMARTKMALGLNQMMSGASFLYYGDELGMKGSGEDENKRAPMYWYDVLEAGAVISDESVGESPVISGMCKGPANMKKNIEMKYGPLAVQQSDGNSIYNYVKEVMKVRNTFPFIARGKTGLVEELSNKQVCVLEKNYQDALSYIVINTSDEIAEITVDGTLLAQLLTGEDPVVVSDGDVQLPPYSIAIMNLAGVPAAATYENVGLAAESKETETSQEKEAQDSLNGPNIPLNTSVTEITPIQVTLDSEFAYANYSKINTGVATLYINPSTARDGKIVCVNAGHGTKGGGSVKTLSHPDGSAKVTGGTTGAGAVESTAVSTGMTFLDGTPESSVTLAQAIILRDKLLSEGYSVLMIRETDDIQLDNIARTVLANNYADCHIALHWDSTENNSGAFYISTPNVASYRAMEPVASTWQKSEAFGKCLVSGLATAGTKIKSSGALEVDLTQTSYSTIPSIDIELGDKAADHSQAALEQNANGLVMGVNSYFGY